MPRKCITTKTDLLSTDVFRVRQGGTGPGSDPCDTTEATTDPPADQADPNFTVTGWVIPEGEESSSSSSSNSDSSESSASSDGFGLVVDSDQSTEEDDGTTVIIQDPGGGGVVPPSAQDPEESSTSGFTFSNLSGDYQAFSYPSNYAAIIETSSENWYIKDPAGGFSNVLVGNRGSGGGAVMQNFMWDNREDCFIWITGTTLQRRRADNTVQHSVTLPGSVRDASGARIAVNWRAGHRSGDNSHKGLFVLGYNHPNNQTFLLPIQTNPLGYDISKGFWAHDVTGSADETSFQNIHRNSNGWIFSPQSDTRQSDVFHVIPGVDNVMTLIEPQVGAQDNWSHPTVAGDVMAVWSNPNGRLEILDISGLKSNPKTTNFPLIRAITVAECATVYGAPGEYVQYLHGHLTGRRLVFSVARGTTGFEMGILVYDFDDDQVYVVETGITAGRAFKDTPRPSISRDGKMTMYLDSRGVTIRPFSRPVHQGAATGEQVFPRVLDRPPYFQWTAGDVSKAEWDTFRGTLNTDVPTGRPKAINNSKFYELTNGGRLYAHVNHEVPTMNAAGELVMAISTDSFDRHNDVGAVKPGENRVLGWLNTRQLYQWDLEFSIDDLNGVNWTDPDDANAVRWAILYQIWGNFGDWKTIPAADRPSNRLSPPFALELAASGKDTLKLICRMRGTSQTNGLIPWEYTNSPEFDIATGKHRVSVWWKKDHTGVDSYCGVWMDGDLLFERENVKLGTPFDEYGNAANSVLDATGGRPLVGLYTPFEFDPPGVEVRHSMHRSYKLDRLPSLGTSTPPPSPPSPAPAVQSIYVDSIEGADSNAGTSAAQAFKTIAKALTVLEVGESDSYRSTLYLKRGSTWNERIALRNFGNLDIKAYGSGPRPKLDGQATLPTTGVPALEGRLTRGMIDITNPYNVLVQDIEVTRSNFAGIAMRGTSDNESVTPAPQQPDNIKIEGCRVTYTVTDGIIVEANDIDTYSPSLGDPRRPKRVVVDDCYIRHTHYLRETYGANNQGQALTVEADDVRVVNCDVADYWKEGIDVLRSTQAVVAYNTIGEYALSSTYDRCVAVYVDAFDFASTDISIYGNSILGGQGGIQFAHENSSGSIVGLDIYSNLIATPRKFGIAAAYSGAYAVTYTGVRIFNNTIDMRGQDQFAFTNVASSGSTLDISLFNNILIGDRNDLVNLGVTGVSLTGYNLYFSTVGTITGTVGGNAIVNQDPLFTGSGDYTLQGGSPAVDAVPTASRTLNILAASVSSPDNIGAY